MPRKPLPADRRRSQIFELQLTPAELEALRDRAASAGLTISDLLIRSTLGKRARKPRKPRQPRTPKPMS